MGDQLLAPWLKIARLRTDYRDNTGMTRGLYTGSPETTGFGGDRLRMSLEFIPTSSRQTPVERAAIRSFLARLRGRQNRAYLWDPSYRGPRGAFSTLAFELLDSTFASGTALSASNLSVSTSVTDRVMRATRTNATGIQDTTLRASGKTTVQYAPYVARVMGLAGRGPMDYRLRLGLTAGNNDVATHAADITTQGLQTLAAVVPATTTHFSILDGVAGRIAGDYMDFPYVSLARAGGLVDNGLNLLLQSDELDTTWTATRASVDDQTAGTTAPDGTSTADALHEDSTAANTHLVAQSGLTVSSAAGDYSFAVAVKAANRSWVALSIEEATGSSELLAYFDVGNGALGAATSGANWANQRSFIQPIGDGWYYCCVVGRKTNAATALQARLFIGEANSDRIFDGLNQDSLYLWRATLAQSSVPARLVQTTTTASSGTSQTGSALHVKGLPASTSGLLLPDDRFEIITSFGSEMKIVTASLDSDAAGRGYLQFEPPLIGVPADNAPIIIQQPMTRAIFAGDMVGWDDSPGILTTASAEFEEA